MIDHKIIPAQNKIRHYSWSTRAWVNFFIECAEQCQMHAEIHLSWKFLVNRRMKNSINAGEMPRCKNSVLHHFITVGEST